jgi:hypothetical protein
MRDLVLTQMCKLSIKIIQIGSPLTVIGDHPAYEPLKFPPVHEFIICSNDRIKNETRESNEPHHLFAGACEGPYYRRQRKNSASI